MKTFNQFIQEEYHSILEGLTFQPKYIILYNTLT